MNISVSTEFVGSDARVCYFFLVGIERMYTRRGLLVDRYPVRGASFLLSIFYNAHFFVQFIVYQAGPVANTPAVPTGAGPVGPILLGSSIVVNGKHPSQSVGFTTLHMILQTACLHRCP